MVTGEIKWRIKILTLHTLCNKIGEILAVTLVLFVAFLEQILCVFIVHVFFRCVR